MEYLNHKVSNEELSLIFKDYFSRSSFIQNYPYFGNDDNNEYYKNFIDDNISNRKFKIQEDAIELSLVTNNFNTSYLDVISKIIHSKRTYWIKLLCLDWLSSFVDEIPPKTFIDLNLYSSKSTSEFLMMQSILNLLLLNNETELSEKLLDTLNQSKDTAIFYRLANGLNRRSCENLTKGTIKKLANSINTSDILVESQKSELIEKISKSSNEKSNSL